MPLTGENEIVQDEPGHRVRLLRAMATLAGERGYVRITIADLVREAGVSKRSFYEHFSSKQACFLALYRAASESALRVLRQAVQVDKPWQTQIEHALGAYFSHMALDPRLLRTLFVEIHHLGEHGAALRREVMQQIVEFVLATIQTRSRAERDGAHALLTPTMAMAAVGGINELVLQAIEQGAAGELQALTPVASELVRALTREELSDL